MVEKNFVSMGEGVAEDNRRLDLAWEDFSSDEYCHKKCEFYSVCGGRRERCLRAAFVKLFETLTETEQTVLKLRFGFCENKPFTQQAIADYLGITPGRVRQITSKALRKLRHPARRRAMLRLKPYYTVKETDFYINLIAAAFEETPTLST